MRAADGYIRSGPKGATSAAYVTSTANGADHQGLDLVEQFAPVYEDNSNGVAAVVEKPLAVSTYCKSIDSSAALEASSVTKASPGVLYAFTGRLDATAPGGTYYLQLLNHSSLPADGAVTLLCAPVKIIHDGASDYPLNLPIPSGGIFASVGIVWCLSTNEFTKAISGAYVSADCFYK